MYVADTDRGLPPYRSKSTYMSGSALNYQSLIKRYL
jgi:hypothetical protein